MGKSSKNSKSDLLVTAQDKDKSVKPCPVCKGSGRNATNTNACPNCRGFGY